VPRPCTVVCDVGGLAPELASIDVLARLQLAAGCLGVEIRLRHASSELLELIAFAGLRDVLRVENASVEMGRQPEEREERLAVEEEGELRDPAR